MPRPKKLRLIQNQPEFTRFRPCGLRRRKLEIIELSIDEYEAIRLADLEGHDHSKAAEEMEISRPTFTRLLEKARNKFATFMVNGYELRIEGGEVKFKGRHQCRGCGRPFADEDEK